MSVTTLAPKPRMKEGTLVVPLSTIQRDMLIQPRAEVHGDWIQEYAMDMANGAEFPPVMVFYDGDNHWLADGFHRVYAAEAAGLNDILAHVCQGTRRDAILYSVGANAMHGHRRTNEDKRRSVDILLKDAEWSEWADREIARLVGVTHPFVADRRKQLSGNGYQMPDTRRATRGGTTYPMDTSRIGSDPPAGGSGLWDREEEPAEPAPEPERFDFAAAAIRDKAMSAIRTLAAMEPVEETIAAWLKSSSYGEPIETMDKASEWLVAFVQRYREAEPLRWARVQAAAAADGGRHVLAE